MTSSVNVVLPQNTSGQIGLKGVAADDGCPVLYLLHGMSDDHSTWIRRTSVERYATQYGLALVMPNAHRSYYTDMACGLKYWTYVSEELPRLMHTFFKISDRREDTFVAGLSMGGTLLLPALLVDDAKKFRSRGQSFRRALAAGTSFAHAGTPG